MKSLTALAAATALLAGISFASAQTGGSTPGGNTAQSPGAINGTSAFCEKKQDSQALDCTFASMQMCETGKAQGSACVPRPAGTTGSAPSR